MDQVAGRSVRLAGITGDHSVTNGVYRPTGRLHNGKELFQKEGDDKWLRYNPLGHWMLSPTANVDANDNGGWVSSITSGLDHPSLAEGWEVGEGKGGWRAIPAVTCAAL